MEFKIYCILNMYGKPIIFVLGILIAIALLVKKPDLWYIKGGTNQKYKKYLECAVYLLILCIGLFGFILSFPLFLDLPAVLTNDFQYVKGEVISFDYPYEDEKKNRTVIIKNIVSGDEEKYYVFRCPQLDEGNIVTIYYYNYSHDGFLK